MTPTTTAIGKAAEAKAQEYLKRHGLALVTKNFRCALGEIDLVMRDSHTLVFVEVRFRQSENFESGAESITRTKVRRLIKTAEYYRLSHPEPDHIDYRFDVVSIGKSIDWIQDAFTADDIRQ